MGGYSHKKRSVSDCLAACFLDPAVVAVLGAFGALVAKLASYHCLGVVLKSFDLGADLQNCDSDARRAPSPF
jgi:hypothetical protein